MLNKFYDYRLCLSALLLTGMMVFHFYSPAYAETDTVLPIQEIKGVFLGRTFLFEAKKNLKRVAVGDLRIASARAISTRQILIKGTNPGWTNLMVWYNDTPRVDCYDFKVEIDPIMIRDAEKLIKKLVPASRVRVIPANQELLLEGEVQSQEDLHRVLQIVTAFFSYKKKTKQEKDEEGKSSTTVNVGTGTTFSDSEEDASQLEQNLDTAVAIKNNLIVVAGCQQVQLEVKIAEVSRSNMKKMGVSFLSNHDWAIGVFPTGTTGGNMTQLSTGENTLASTTEITSPFGSAFQVLLHSADDDFLALLSILKGQSLARLLATPTLVTLSGQTARFNVGGEFPVPTTDSEGSTSISYKEYGVTLEFTPTVIDKEKISLKVSPEVSSPDWSLGTASGGVSVPGVKTRKAHATLQLKDGQTFVMAGLLKEDSYSVVSKIPLLGDLPVIGSLFTSKEEEKDETELIIMVTPRLVKPLNPSELASLPGDTLHDNPSDVDFFLLNKTGWQAKTNGFSELARRRFVGNIGFEK